MKILNIHKRTIDCSKEDLVHVLATLAGKNDQVWPSKSWPPIHFSGNNQVGSKGGHGPVRYVIENFDPTGSYQFRFLRPKGFNGIHKFEINAITAQRTEVIHTIDMTTKGKATLKWYLVFRPLHNALLEDLLDRVESHFTDSFRAAKWGLWVRLLRLAMH